jgi:hypothetical protein
VKTTKVSDRKLKPFPNVVAVHRVVSRFPGSNTTPAASLFAPDYQRRAD